MANAEAMPLPGGVERFEAENALDTIVRAGEIEADPKMMAAVGEVAILRANEASKIADKLSDGVADVHPDSNRPGKLNF